MLEGVFLFAAEDGFDGGSFEVGLGDEFAAGVDALFDFFAADETRAAKKKMTPGAQTEVAQTETARPDERERTATIDAAIRREGGEQRVHASGVLLRGIDGEDDGVPAIFPVVRQAHAHALEIGRGDRRE